MADVIGLSDVSSKDTGKGSQLPSGDLKRKYKMAEKEKSSKKCPVGYVYYAKTKKCLPTHTPKDLQPRAGEGWKMLKKEFTKYPKKINRKKISRKRKEA